MNFTELHRKAHEAGMAAATPAKGETVGLTDGHEHFVLDDFPCGFAWVHFAGNTDWARWAKKAGLASKDYPNGLSIWVSDFNQSMTKKEAYATAYAKVLRENGVDAYARSRMD